MKKLLGGKRAKTAVMLFSISLFIFLSCKKDSSTATNPATGTVINVDKTKFLPAGLSESITIVSHALSNGATADCFKIVTKSTPTDHIQGPWCPTNISDDKSKGGIWLDGGNVYDVDGAFIKNLATFYHNTTWQMYNTSTGVITKTLAIPFLKICLIICVN